MKKIFPSWHLTSVVLASFQVWMFLVFVCWMVLVLAHHQSTSTTPSRGGERRLTALVECVPSCFHIALLFVLQCFFLFMSYTFLQFSTSFIRFTLLPFSLHLTLLFVLQCLFLLFNTYSQLFYILSMHLALPPSYFHLTLFVLETRRSSDLKAKSY